MLAILAIALLATACGPKDKLEIGVRSAPVNIPFGDRDKPAAAPPPKIPTSGLGLITAPVPLDQGPAVPFVPEPTPSDAPAPVACPIAPVNAAAEEAAPSTVMAPPKEGMYRFRREGFLKVGNTGDTAEAVAKLAPQPLSDLVLRQVTNVTTTAVPGVSEPRITYDVVQIEPGVRTTTSYLIEPVGNSLDPRIAAGLKITKIVLERADLPGAGPSGSTGQAGIETFEPQPPVTLMRFPAAGEADPEPSTYSQGVDPVTGATMKVYSATQGRATVDVCGRVIQGWRVRVSFQDIGTGPRESTYDRPGVRSYRVSGDFVFAPQFALILRDAMSFVGSDVGTRPYEMQSMSTLNSLDPA